VIFVNSISLSHPLSIRKYLGTTAGVNYKQEIQPGRTRSDVAFEYSLLESREGKTGLPTPSFRMVAESETKTLRIIIYIFIYYIFLCSLDGKKLGSVFAAVLYESYINNRIR